MTHFKKMYIDLHVSTRYSCPIVINLGFSRQILKPTQIPNSVNILRVGAQFLYAVRRTNGQTDGQTVRQT